MDQVTIKYRRIVDWHIKHFQDQKLSGDKCHMLVCYFLLINQFLKYADYAQYCAEKDIAGVSKERWEIETK